MSYIPGAEQLKKEIDSKRKIVDAVNNAGGIRVERVQSDKLGFDWDSYYVNDILVRQVYVEQEIKMGTADNPIIWKETMQLIQNAFYVYNDERKVWTGEQGAAAPWDDEHWAVF